MRKGFWASPAGLTRAGVLATLVLVGAVRATTSASGDAVGPSDSTVPVDSSLPPGEPSDTTFPTPAPTVDDLLARVEELTARVAELEGTVATMASTIERTTQALTALGGRVDDAEKTVAAFADKTSQLATDGTYTGSIGPSQISPRLTVDDIRGNWPLDRTDGSLGLGRLVADGWGCTQDSRSVVALVVGAFRGVECSKISK